MSNSILKMVLLVFEDKVLYLEDPEQVKQWNDMASAGGSMLYAHGMNYPPLAWKEFKAEMDKPV